MSKPEYEYHCPSLKSLCITMVRQNFNKLAKETKTFPALFDEVIFGNDSSTLIFSADVGARHIDHEGFWEREAWNIAQDKLCVLNANGVVSWKRFFCEQYLARALLAGNNMASVTSRHSDDDVLSMTSAIKDYVFTQNLQNIRVCQLGSVLSVLPNLMSLHLQYGTKDIPFCDMANYSVGGMQIGDIKSLTQALESMRCLCSLSLTNNQLDDDMVRLLVEELQHTYVRNTLIDLDLSHNKIATEGLRVITQYFLLDENEEDFACDAAILANLKLAGNSIRAEGARTLGRILKTNTSLVTLDIQMNRLEDEGGQLLVDGLREKNYNLRHLNLSSNSISSLTVRSMCKLFEDSRGTNLESIDLSSNSLRKGDFGVLAVGLQQASRVKSLDLRDNCGLTYKETQELLKTIADSLNMRSRKLLI